MPRRPPTCSALTPKLRQPLQGSRAQNANTQSKPLVIGIDNEGFLHENTQHPKVLTSQLMNPWRHTCTLHACPYNTRAHESFAQRTTNQRIIVIEAGHGILCQRLQRLHRPPQTPADRYEIPDVSNWVPHFWSSRTSTWPDQHRYTHLWLIRRSRRD